MTSVLIPLADGVEEIEAVIIIDVLRRAQWSVTAVGMQDGPVTASRNVRLVPDKPWAAVNPGDFDILMIPGGSGAVATLAADAHLLDVIRMFERSGKWIGAVCAGPLVLQAAGILKGRKVTCHPGAAPKLTVTGRSSDRVVVDGKLVTSQGPGTSFEFALTMVRLVDGPDRAEALARSMVL